MRLSLSEVTTILTDHFQSGVSDVVPTNQGEWSQAFFFTVANQNKVVRFSQVDEDFRRDQFASRFATPQLPIPPIEEIGQAFGGYFAISSKIEGTMIDHLDLTEMEAIVPELLSLFDSLRTADISKTTGYGGWDAHGNGAMESWKTHLLHVTDEDPTNRVQWREKLTKRKNAYRIFQEAYRKMGELLDFCPEDRHLIHNDLMHMNLLVHNHKIVGVIDWGCSFYGDFLYDLAMFILWQFYYPSMQGIDFRNKALAFFATRGVSLPHFEQRIRCYQLNLAMDAMKYCAFKDNEKDLDLITGRVKEIIK